MPYGQPHPGFLAHTFGGEKGLEDLVPDFGERSTQGLEMSGGVAHDEEEAAQNNDDQGGPNDFRPVSGRDS